MSAARRILRVIKDGETIKSLPIEAAEVVLGRGEGCVIRLEDRAISREHAVFRAVEGGIHVEKRSEFAPLSVNGIECTQAIVKEADVISIGPYLLRVGGEDKATASSTSSPLASSPAEISLDPPSVTGPVEPEIAPEAEPEVRAEVLADVPAESGGLELSSPAIGEVGLEAPVTDQSGDSGMGISLEMPGEVSGNGSADVPGPDGMGLELSDANPEAPVGGFGAPSGGLSLESVEEAADDAATKLTPAAKLSVKLIIPSGVANVTEFEITQDEVSIGRGSNCDVVLEDKKASRKNAIIRRAGLSFTIKDLDSANGTYVNGQKITEQELFADDVIRIGGAEMTFQAKSADYDQRAADFIPVPAFTDGGSAEIPQMDGLMLDPSQSQQDQLDAGALQPGGALMLDGGNRGPAGPIQVGLGVANPGQPNFGQIPGLGGVAGAAGITGIAPPDVKQMGVLDKLRNFKDLPPRLKLIYGFIVLGFIYFLVFDEEAPEPKPVAPKKGVVKVNKGPLTFEQLPPDKQRFVEAQHSLAFDHYKNKEYDKAIFELGKIFAIINDYKDSREIERYAKEGKRKLEAFEEEKRKKEEEVRLKERIQALVDEAKARMDHKDYEQARELFAQISILDPDNSQITQWKREIEEYEEQKRLKEQEEQVRKEINARAWDVLNEGLALKKKGKYHSAIDVLVKVADIGPTDKKVVARSVQEIARCKAAIRGLREPVLTEARKLEEAGEYTKAFNLFRKATRLDPPHPEGYAGMARIRDVLHERGKVIYTEAVLAESYSDFATAKKKYTEILAVVPREDIYYERAQRKLSRFFKSNGDPLQ